MLTFDWDDFVALHDRGVAHTGVVACEVDADPYALASRIDIAVKAHRSLANRFIEVRT